MFRILSLLLALIMLSGCGSKDVKDEPDPVVEPKTETKTEEKATEAKTEEPTEISVMIWDRGDAPAGKTVEDNTLVDWIKESVLEAANVKVNFIAVPRSGSDDKVNVMMAGGNAPDIILSYSSSMFGSFATSGGLTDLTAALAEYGPTLQTELDGILEVGQVDGVQYAIPARRSLQKTKHIGYIRKDWVEALGKELPTTKEELTELLYAFKEQNPGKVENVIPWAMGGNQDTEKYFLNFVGSYVDISNEKDQVVYMKNFKAIAPGAEEGFKVLNTLYNDGIISQDFAVDTTDDKYKQDIAIGNVGFFVDDNFRPIDSDWLATLKANVPTAEFVPINAFESPDASYVNPADPLYGAYIMVPSVSSDKAEAVVKYLNWLASTENAMKVAFTPEYTVDAKGAPVAVKEEDLAAKGYAKNRNDYCIVTQFFEYDKTKEATVAVWQSKFPTFDEAYYNNVYDQVTAGIYNEPLVTDVIESETKYLTNLNKMIIEYAYKLISVKPAEFEATQKAVYGQLVEAGLQEIIDERASYYDANVAK